MIDCSEELDLQLTRGLQYYFFRDWEGCKSGQSEGRSGALLIRSISDHQFYAKDAPGEESLHA